MLRWIRSRRCCTLALLVVLLAVAAGEGSAQATPFGSTFVVPDVHGDFASLTRVLRACGLVDSSLQWSGGNATLVQLGDLVDRGPHSFEIIRLLMRLEREAASASGAVYVLWGNHEVMQLMGNLRYVHEDELEGWHQADQDWDASRSSMLRLPAKPSSAMSRRAVAARQMTYSEFLEGLLGFLGQVASSGSDDESEVDRATPLRGGYYGWLVRNRVRKYGTLYKAFSRGYFAHRKMWAPDGWVGRWLLDSRHHPLVMRLHRTLLLHAGLHEKYAFYSIDELNSIFFQDMQQLFAAFRECCDMHLCHWALGLKSFTGLINAELGYSNGTLAHLPYDARELFFFTHEIVKRSPIFDTDGPLWYRGWTRSQRDSHVLHSLLQRYKADTMIVGHTIPSDMFPQVKYDGRLIQLDAGMNRYKYGGAAAAAVLRPGSSEWEVIVASLLPLLDD